MDRTQRRTQIIQACLQLQQQVASTAKTEMDSCQQQSNDYGANVDRYDAYRTKLLRQRDMYAKQLSNANASIRVLQELLRVAPMNVADHGAIVITNKQKFFMSLGVGKFMVPYQTPDSVPQEVFFAISAQTPIYMALRGSHVGDSITFNGQSQIIEDIL